MADLITTFASKANPDAPVGVSFKESHGKIFLTKVIESSIFFGSSLKAGHEVVTINGTSVRGMSLAEVKAILGSIRSEVIIESRVGMSEPVQLECTIEKNGFDVAFEAPSLPAGLREVGVSSGEWNSIVQSFANELISEVRHVLKMDKLLSLDMEKYTKTQMVGGAVGFGAESNYEKKIFLMTQQTAIQHSNLSMVASNVLMEANAILNPYHVKAKLGFTTKDLPQFSKSQGGRNIKLVPTSLHFSSC